MNKIINILNEREDAINELSQKIDSETIFLCVGTHKVINDAVGPMVGTILENSIVPTVGSMAFPIDGISLNDTLEQIKAVYPNSNIIVIDAAIGKKEQVGNIYYKSFGLRPGGAIRSDAPLVGHASIVAIVSSSTDDSLMGDDSSYEKIGKISHCIADFVKDSFTKYKK